MAATDMNRNGRSSRHLVRRAGVFAIVLCICFAGSRGVASSATGKDETTLASSDGSAATYFAGENLEYKLGWAAFSNAADVQLAVVEQRQPTASPLLHLRATLRSLPPLRNLFPVDDQFESFSDARTLESRQYEFHLNELGETENRVAHLATVAGARAAHLPGVIVPAGTQDPLGVLYSMRAVDWTREPTFKTLMFDGNDIFEVRAHVEVLSETLAAASTNFRASRIEVRLFQHGDEVPKTALSIWFADERRHTPVLLEAATPYGNIRAELLANGKR
jgi:hypothetical protein